jgi:CPA2 family monovalent cation:H+ antiporter-2
MVLELLRPRIEARFGSRPVVAPSDVRVEPGELSAASQGPATTDIPSEAAIERGPLGPDGDVVEPLTLTGHAVLVGYGQVGRIVAEGLKAAGRDIVVIEDSDHDVAAARAAGLEVIYGNAASQDVLKLANLGGAKDLLVAISNAFEAGSVCESGRKLNPDISIVARAYSEEEEDFLRGLGATVVIRGEREIGKGILELLRSEASDAPAPVVVEAPLPPTENILAQAAVPVAVLEPIIPMPVAVVETPAEVEVSEAPVSAVEIPVIEATSVIELPPRADEPEPADVPLAELVPIEPAETPSIGEAPPAIDEIVVLPPSAPVAEAVAEEPKDEVVVEAAVEGEPEIAEVITEAPADEAAPSEAVPAEDEAKPADSDEQPAEVDGSDDEDEDKKPGPDVPVVNPEPRG